MKEKDITEKKLLSYNDVFADVINGTIFEGKEVVKSEELTDANPVTQFKIPTVSKYATLPNYGRKKA